MGGSVLSNAEEASGRKRRHWSTATRPLHTLVVGGLGGGGGCGRTHAVRRSVGRSKPSGVEPNHAGPKATVVATNGVLRRAKMRGFAVLRERHFSERR